MSTICKPDVTSEAECLTRSARTHGLDPDSEQARWAAIFTAECGFFAAARLRCRLSVPFLGALTEGVAREAVER
jgi:hypothetical protein